MTGVGRIIRAGCLQATLAAVFCACSSGVSSAEGIVLPAPEGRFGVGYSALAMTTDNPDNLEPGGDGMRRLHLELFYPAAASAAKKPYATPFVAASLSADFPLPEGFSSEVSGHSRLRAPAADGVFPLVLFSHGLSWPVTLYQSLIEDLASRGYVVVAVNHPHAAAIDYGAGVTRGRERWPRIADEDERQAMLAARVTDIAEDLRDVLTEVQDWTVPADGNPVAGHIDLARVAAWGHSLGGTAAGMLTAESTIDAVAVMEGKPRNADGTALTVRKPLLHLIGGYNRLELEGQEYLPSAGAPVYQAVINGTGHAYFSDLIYLYRNYADADWQVRHRYETDPGRVIQITRDYLAAFFGRYLKDEDSGVLLRPVSYRARVDNPRSGGYPEVELSILVN